MSRTVGASRTSSSATRTLLPMPHRVILFVVIALVIVGLITVASAGVFYAETRFEDEYFFFKRQLIGVGIGFVALFFFQAIDYRFWRRLAAPFFVVALLCLIAVLVPGIGERVYGASRWLYIGPFSFQPSEMTKLAYIFYLAAWFSRARGRKAGDLFEDLAPFLAVLGVVAFLILAQPDTGTFGLIFFVSITMYFVAGARWTHLFGIFVAGLALLGILVKTAPYRLRRILVFFDPGSDIQGAGYQIHQALIAIGSGGLFGLGLGYSRQKFNYLPEPVTDSIFAVFAEEWGFVVSALLVGLFVLLAWQGLRIAREATDDFGRYVAVGIVSWITFQAFVNMAAATALIPLTGIPLPFVSYGGTSIAFLIAATGILIRIGKQSRLER